MLNQFALVFLIGYGRKVGPGTEPPTLEGRIRIRSKSNKLANPAQRSRRNTASCKLYLLYVHH